MQILEIVIFWLSFFFLGITFRKRVIDKQYVVFLIVITIIALSVHIVFENVRWQLYPIFLAVFGLGVITYLRTYLDMKIKNALRFSVIIVGSLLILISLVSAFVFPIYKMPLPNGDYLIGTESFVIEDESRLELYSDDATENRKIKIQMWYPAEEIEGYDQVPWLQDGKVVARALSSSMGFPSFVLDHTVDVMSNSYLKAPLSNDEDSYPVVIISHGWTGFRNIHNDFAEELASLGYIVIGIDHAYGSVATKYSDDDIAYLNLDALPDRDTTDDFLDYANQLVNTYAMDVTLTIDYLEEMNDSISLSRFSEKLDLTKIGLLGHSTGGGADVKIALNDPRIDSVIGLDAWVEPIVQSEIDKGLNIPSLFLRSGVWETGFNNNNLYSLIDNSTYQSMLYQIDGTTHYDFAMVYMYSPLTKTVGFSGDVKSEYLTSILKTMITDFFDNTLKNDIDSEIDIEQWDEVRQISTE